MKTMFLVELSMIDGRYLHTHFLWVIIIFMYYSKVKGIL